MRKNSKARRLRPDKNSATWASCPCHSGRLESYFGITPGPRRPVVGEAEAIDLDTVDKLLHPKGKQVEPPPPQDDLPPDN